MSAKRSTASTTSSSVEISSASTPALPKGLPTKIKAGFTRAQIEAEQTRKAKEADEAAAKAATATMLGEEDDEDTVDEPDEE